MRRKKLKNLTVCMGCGRKDTAHPSGICGDCTGSHHNENAQVDRRWKPKSLNADGTKRVVAPGPAPDDNDGIDLENNDG